MSKKESVFNLISIIVLGGLFLYFGSRAVYWFVYELGEAKNRDNSAAYYVINDNEKTDSENGLFEVDGSYYFKGETENNYVTIGGALYRILSINENNEMKLVLDDVAASFMWGDDLNYEESNINNWLGEDGEYYDNLIDPEKYLVKTKFTVDNLSDGELTTGEEVFSNYVTTLSITDYENAGAEESYLNNGKYFWLTDTSDGENLYVDANGLILIDSTFGSYGVRPVITLKSDVIRLRGEGTKTNPIYIDTKEDTTYINTYITLGDDTYKVFDEEENILKLGKTESIANVTKTYSSISTKYDITDETSLAYYLNNEYLNSLSYAGELEMCTFNTGVVNNETGNKYDGIFSETTDAKVGLFSAFDYNNNDLEDYFYLTNTGLVSEVAYVKSENGLLKKSQISEEKVIVPVVCLNKDKIVDGVGTDYSPYTIVKE